MHEYLSPIYSPLRHRPSGSSLFRFPVTSISNSYSSFNHFFILHSYHSRCFFLHSSPSFASLRRWRLLERKVEKQNEAYISPEIWDEYNDVIERMTKKYPSRLKQQLIDEVFKLFKVVIPSSEISICRDPDDDKFISCALDAECMYLVSGDDDLLSLENISQVTICTPSEFLNVMEKEETL